MSVISRMRALVWTVSALIAAELVYYRAYNISLLNGIMCGWEGQASSLNNRDRASNNKKLNLPPFDAPRTPLNETNEKVIVNGMSYSLETTEFDSASLPLKAPQPDTTKTIHVSTHTLKKAKKNNKQTSAESLNTDGKATQDLALVETNKNVIVNGVSYSLETTEFDSTIFPLPKPILVVGLPKAGTSTIHDFFSANYSSVHWKDYRCVSRAAKLNQTVVHKCFVGACMLNAHRTSRPLLQTCGSYDVWAQMDNVSPLAPCVFPQISLLEQLHKEAPNATLLFNRRQLNRWSSSVLRWYGGYKKPLSQRLAACSSLPGLVGSSRKDLINWHRRHIRRIRKFVEKHPSHALLEIDIEDPATAETMGRAFGIPASSWGHANQNAAKARKKTGTTSHQSAARTTMATILKGTARTKTTTAARVITGRVRAITTSPIRERPTRAAPNVDVSYPQVQRGTTRKEGAMTASPVRGRPTYMPRTREYKRGQLGGKMG